MAKANTPQVPGLLPRWRAALVIGAGLSGVAAARLLAAAGVPVRVYDRRPHTQAAPHPGVAALPPGCALFLGEDAVPAAALQDIDVMVLSPGVPPAPILERQRAHAPEALVHGELSLALLAIRARWPGIPTALITGTNGKSTVTALLGALLEAAGQRPFVGGNLGTPLSDAVLESLSGARPDALVLECSSYQLETVRGDFPVHVGMVLNVTPDHLSRYASMAEYADTKGRVLHGLTAGGLALLEAADPWTPRLRAQVPPRAELVLVDPSGLSPRDIADAAVAEILGEGPGHALRLASGEQLPRARLQLAGRHNSKNALFALTAARHLGASLADCERGLAGFSGLPHRMERIGAYGDVLYYNDSKATNVASVLASLDGFDRPFVLIAGGQPKGDDLSPLRALLASRGRGLVAIGEAASAVLAATGGIVPSTQAETMAQAVDRAREMARPGDAVILSPACSSFDWYESYHHRGEDFRAIVRALERAAG
ncbi:MAG: UDP-N-acetylmuramoyl-L-alanine--D-glutamate ligase [Myxococcales bacterium]|nr:UDP-N-acetylmuramoyl-L-alanine--D-glutamate ligase [Myxococcales bacterium]MCB9748929.1 UDP-N-acetylmuramoyl-L-alanine--D-glutamate ligase [Myxococcales bacterium]